MATMAEGRMNLAATQQRDPYITDIVDTASQVALYSFSSKTNEWEKTDVEGTLFVYTRSASPINGFMILNRLGLNDLIEPIDKNLEFQLQDPFLLYRNAQSAIYGIWFYDKDECARIGQLMNSFVQIAIGTNDKKETAAGRQRRASESDTLYERTEMMAKEKNNVDILEMLSKAQDEYDRSKCGSGEVRRPEPKPMINNPNAAATTSSTLIKPLPIKVLNGSQAADMAEEGAVGGAAAAESTTPTTQISLETLFRRASMQQAGGAAAPPLPEAPHPPRGLPFARSQSSVDPRTTVAPSNTSNQMPPLLQRLMSNPGTSLEEIERQQRGEIPRDQMPKPAGAEAPPGVANGIYPRCSPMKPAYDGCPEPQSPDTALKRTLNILPPTQKQPIKGQYDVQQSPGTAPKLQQTSHSPVNTLATSLVDSLKKTSKGGDLSTSSQAQASGSQIVNELAKQFTTMATGGAVSVSQQTSGDMDTRLPAGISAITGAGHSPAGGGTEPGKSSLLSGQTSGQLTSQQMGPGKEEVGKIPFPPPPTTSETGGMSTSGSRGELLMTPMAFQSSGSPRITPSPGAVLPPPAAFQPAGASIDAASAQPRFSLGQPGGSSADLMSLPQVTPLTREQLQQALIYLIRNDSDFLRTIHEAYVKSLHSELSSYPKL